MSRSAPILQGLRDGTFLAAGGYAEVFRYEQVNPQRAVAVKVLLDANLSAAAREQFQRESDTMGKLEAHSNVIRVYFTGTTDDGRPYLVMELCQQQHLGQRAPLPVDEVLRYGVQVAGAVEYAHRLDVLHHDIKPANLLLARNNAPKLTDFGIAAALSGSGGEPEAMSIPWSPPEVLFRTAPVGTHSDVYSLAATLWTLLAGPSPFEVPGGDNSRQALLARISAGNPTPPSRHDVPDSLLRLLRTAMARDPGRRPVSAEQFGRLLQQEEHRRAGRMTELEIPVVDAWSAIPRDAPVQTTPPAPAAETNLRVPVVQAQRRPRERLLPGTPDLAATQIPQGQEPEAAVVPQQPARRKPVVVLAGLAVAALVTAGAGLLLRFQDDPPDRKPPATADGPADAVPEGAVPVPVVEAVRDGDTVRFSWTYDDHAAGDYFKVRRTDGTPGQVETIARAEFVVSAPPPAHPCIEVTLYRSNGQGSPGPAKRCES